MTFPPCCAHPPASHSAHGCDAEWVRLPEGGFRRGCECDEPYVRGIRIERRQR